ncbi:MAG: DnaA/Hda family protein [Fibromonadales bacterium]|nr:DnaA/Hda family protein [Fibromonadales bacterium]
MNISNKTTVDSFINGIILLDKSVSDYTLDSDFIFKGNYKCLKKAIAYAKKTIDNIVKKQPLSINPLIFAGKVDCYKNRLMLAIWNSLTKEKLSRGEPEAAAIYLQVASGHDPMNNIYKKFSIKRKKEVYRKLVERVKNLDIVFINEIQYLEGKHEAMSLLLEMVKFMESINKPIIMTSQKTDLDKAGLIPELAERFESFEYIKIPLPDAEDRIKMLEDFLKEENLSLENELIKNSWQENTEKYSLKHLMGKLNRLTYEAKNSVITAETIEYIFEEKDSMRKILDAVCEYFRIDVKTLIIDERRFACERAIAMYFMKNINREMSFSEIGRRLKRSEDTARIACDKIGRIVDGDKEFINKKKPSQIKTDVEEIGKALNLLD